MSDSPDVSPGTTTTAASSAAGAGAQIARLVAVEALLASVASQAGSAPAPHGDDDRTGRRWGRRRASKQSERKVDAGD